MQTNINWSEKTFQTSAAKRKQTRSPEVGNCVKESIERKSSQIEHRFSNAKKNVEVHTRQSVSLFDWIHLVCVRA